MFANERMSRMESQYFIGPITQKTIEITKNKNIFLNADKDNYIVYKDSGQFEQHVQNRLGKNFFYNGFPEFGWTWIVNREMLINVINDYLNMVGDEEIISIFKDIDIKLPNVNGFYIKWIDWS